MQRTDIRRIWRATLSTFGLTLTACSQATPSQGGGMGGMMGGGYGNGWMGRYGGPWMLILLVVIAALAAWIFARRRNKD